MIGPEGDAADIVRKTGGQVHREDDLDQITDALARIHRRRDDTKKAADESSRPHFDRKYLTGLLATQLDDLADRG